MFCFLQEVASGLVWRLVKVHLLFGRPERHLPNENVVVKVALLDGAIGEDHLAVAVLDAALPLADVAGLIHPDHLPVAVSLVVFVLTTINVA